MLNLMQTQIATLFKLDQRGRLLAVNEPGSPRAPRFFMGRTSAGNSWAFRHDIPDDLVAAIAPLCAAEPIAHDRESPPRYAPAIRSLLGVGSHEWRGPAFLFPEILPQHAGATLLAPDALACLSLHFQPLQASFAARTPVAAVIADGVAIAVCCASRRGARAAEAGVETIAEMRGRGHALAVVATWARAVRTLGHTPLYSTSWENHASRAVAQRLGLIEYGEDWSID
jgi:FR47-like protein